MIKRNFHFIAVSIIITLAISGWASQPLSVRAARSIVFPIAGSASFSNDFNAPRPDGIHGATDIFAPKMRPLLSAIDGVVTFVAYPQASWGYSLNIRDDEGYSYRYLHINNDTPGTDDGNGGPMNAYAVDMKSGNRVFRGQLIGWVGDSGNAETTSPHLHFEIYNPSGERENPYDSLVDAERRQAPIAHYPQLPNEILPYGPTYTGGINIARGNFDADDESETVTGAGFGGAPHVRLYDDNDAAFGTGFYAYNPGFNGGVDVATGDVDGDGIDEIITAAGPGGGPHIRILRHDGSEISGFYAYSSLFSGGVRVAAGDVDNDGTDEIITGVMSGGGPHVRVFEPDGTEVSGFYGFAPNFTGGVDIASADVAGTGSEEIIVAAGPGGSPHIRVFAVDGTELTSFHAYAPDFSGGVRVSAGNVRTSSAKAEIVTVPASGGSSHQRMFSGTGSLIDETTFLEQWWVGYFDVAAGYDETRAAAGTNRRATVRHGVN